MKRFITKCKARQSNHDIVTMHVTYPKISDEEIQDAINYFYKKATNEVKHFSTKEKYEKISFEKMKFCTILDEFYHLKKSHQFKQ